MRPGLLIFGPTSSGKTAVSLDVAVALRERGLRPVVLNADSRQVYRYMDIGTSKLGACEMRGTEHRLLDVADPDRKVSLERYVDLARATLEELVSDDAAVPIVVGGTGTYVKAILEQWAVRGTAARRMSIERDFPRTEPGEAYKFLRRVAPEAAARTHPRNYEAIVNALVRRLDSNSDTLAPATPPFRFRTIGLDRGVRATEERVVRTLHEQFRRGLVEEVLWLDGRYNLVRQFAGAGKASPNQVLHTHGYREFVEYAVERRLHLASLRAPDLVAIRSQIEAHILAYARRQRAWFKKLPHTRFRPGAAVNGALSLLLESKDGPVS